MKLEGLGILDLLRGGAGMAIGVCVEIGVLGSVLVCGLGVGPSVNGINMKEDIDNCKM